MVTFWTAIFTESVKRPVGAPYIDIRLFQAVGIAMNQTFAGLSGGYRGGERNRRISAPPCIVAGITDEIIKRVAHYGIQNFSGIAALKADERRVMPVHHACRIRLNRDMVFRAGDYIHLGRIGIERKAALVGGRYIHGVIRAGPHKNTLETRFVGSVPVGGTPDISVSFHLTGAVLVSNCGSQTPLPSNISHTV